MERRTDRCQDCGTPVHRRVKRCGTCDLARRRSGDWVERFWAKVNRDGPVPEHRPELGPCWQWTAGTAKEYGQFYVAGHNQKAHRVAYTLTFGEPPAHALVCHHCDHPPCCNPAHLFLGTSAENTDDAAHKGRMAHGERNGRAKLTAQQVRDIRASFAGGASKKRLSRDYGVSRPVIKNIVERRSWRRI